MTGALRRDVKSRRRSVYLPWAVFAAATLLAWGRLPEGSRVRLWAEDATRFLQRAIEPESIDWWILTPFGGYIHSVPQLIASVSWMIVPPSALATAFAFASCVVAGATASLVFALTGQWGLPTPARLLASLTTVLAPGLTYEVLGNLANLHWFLLWLSPFLFLASPRRWRTASALGIVAFAVTTTEIQTALFAPLLLWRWRDSRRWPVAAGAIIGLVIQAVAFLSIGRGTSAGASSWLAVLNGYVLQVPLVGLTGTAQAASAVALYSGWLAAYGAMIPFFLAAALFFARRRTRFSALLVAGVFVASFLLWTAGYVLNRGGRDFADLTSEEMAGGVPLLRYAVVPIMLLFLVAAIALGSQMQVERGRARWTATSAVVAVLCASIFAVSYRVNVDPRGAEGATWAASVSEAAAHCRESADQYAEIGVPPLGGRWIVRIPCSSLE